jgi:hypothetical protein
MSIFDPLSNDLYTIPVAELYFRPAGETEYINLGSADAITLEVAVEEAEKFAAVRGIRTLVKRVVTSVSANISFTLAQMTPFARAASVMSAQDVAGTSETFTINGEVMEIESGSHKSGIANDPRIRGELVIRGTNVSGPKSLIVLWDIEVRPASARELTAEDFGTIQLSGTAYPVAGKPAGYELGQEATITGVVTQAAQ